MLTSRHTYASCLLAFGLLCINSTAEANSVTITDQLLPSTPLSKAPAPITPVFATITNFTGYTGPFPYKTGTFYVGSAGAYSATLNSAPLSNGFYILRGTFSPSTGTPSTPLSNFMVFSQQLTNTTINNINLQPGQQYSYLWIFSSGTAALSFMLTGPGCISFTTNTCSLTEAQHFTHLASVNRDFVRTTSGLLRQRMEFARSGSSGEDFFGDKNFWIRPFGSWANQGSRDGVAGYKAETYGIALGAEGALTPDVRAGVSFAYAAADVDGKDTTAQGTQITFYQLAGYGSYTLDDRTYVDFHGGLGKSSNKGHREIASSPFTAQSNFDGYSYQSGVAVVHRYDLSTQTSLSPSVRLDYSHIKLDSYQETGAGGLELAVQGKTLNSTVVGVDGKIAHKLNSSTSISAQLGVGYDLNNKRDDVAVAFANSPTTVTVVPGMQSGPWLGRGGLGIAYKAKDGLEIGARYDAEFRDQFFNQTASIRLRWAF